MATNSKLRAALLSRLGISPQALSQRVKKIKNNYGPMSTEDATYVIAHLEKIDITKYLEPSIVDRIRSILPDNHIKKTPPSRKKDKSEVKKQVTIKINIGSSLQKCDALLSTTLAEDARKMANLYPKYYILENSIRVVIKRILENNHGDKWWDTRVPRPVCDNVEDRKRKEAKNPWHGKRGQHEIFYSGFGDLKRIILNNWGDFKDLFPSQPWITQKLAELEHPRNVLAHHNPVSTTDQQRIDLYFHDWISLVQSHSQLIP
ncbi:hypothetical protein KA005_11210 [bacterium]|nr:hypothetical protein [bacterium]